MLHNTNLMNDMNYLAPGRRAGYAGRSWGAAAVLTAGTAGSKVSGQNQSLDWRFS